MISSPDDVHLALAASVTDAATLLATHTDVSPLSAVEIGYDHAEGLPRARCQLGPCETSRLGALVAWADALDDATVTACRVESYDPPFTAVSVHSHTGGTAVQVWTHPDADEVAALFSAAGHAPEPGVTASISVETVRAASEEVRRLEAEAEAETAEAEAEDEANLAEAQAEVAGSGDV